MEREIYGGGFGNGGGRGEEEEEAIKRRGEKKRDNIMRVLKIKKSGYLSTCFQCLCVREKIGKCRYKK